MNVTLLLRVGLHKRNLSGKRVDVHPVESLEKIFDNTSFGSNNIWERKKCGYNACVVISWGIFFPAECVYLLKQSSQGWRPKNILAIIFLFAIECSIQMLVSLMGE